MIHTSDSHGAYQSLLGLVFAGWYVAVLSNLTDFEPFLVVPTLTPLVGINVGERWVLFVVRAFRLFFLT